METCFLGGSDSGGARRTEGCKFLAHPPTSAASGRPMVLTVEGNPTDSLITNGGYGNAKRVGHDISPNWVGAGDPPDASAMTCPPILPRSSRWSLSSTSARTCGRSRTTRRTRRTAGGGTVGRCSDERAKDTV